MNFNKQTLRSLKGPTWARLFEMFEDDDLRYKVGLYLELESYNYASSKYLVDWLRENELDRELSWLFKAIEECYGKESLRILISGESVSTVQEEPPAYDNIDD